MRRMFGVALAASAMLGCSAQAPSGRLEYELTPILESGALTAVQVDLRFRGEADGETDLRLPDDWSGQPELFRAIADVTAVSGATIANGETANQRILTHRPNARLHVRYRVIQDFEGAPNARQDNSYRPVIQPTYFHLIGNAFMVTPGQSAESTPVRFRVRGLPRDWLYASDLEHPDLRLGDAWSSVVIGGDFRIHEDRANRVRVALRGEWSFTDEAFTESVVQIIAAQRHFFGDRPSPYLVTVIPLESPQQGWLSIGGTGLDDAFAFFATTNAEAAQITRTLAHEGLHTWIPGAIGGMPNEEQALDYWLSEGFTDFLTGRVLVRERIWTPEQFANDLNEALRAYAQSPERASTNARVLEAFWSSQDVQRLPYLRGRFLATIWDQRLRASGRDFDDVVLRMRARVEAGDERHAVEIFPEVIRELGVDPAAEIERYITNGEAILLPEDAFAPCGVIETRQVPAFHRGFNIEATQANNNIITGVDPTHPAYAAGMRDGMTLIRRDGGEIGNASLEIGYVVRDGDVERTLRYIPQSAQRFTEQRLVLSENLIDNALGQCVAVIGGT
jgi:predicted metalloprotease with PDZ domain